MNSQTQPQSFSWQQFGQDVAMYLAIGILGYFIRRYGHQNRRHASALHEKIDKLDGKISASQNGNPVTHPSPAGTVESVLDLERSPARERRRDVDGIV